jgi:hypothetical protein
MKRERIEVKKSNKKSHYSAVTVLLLDAPTKDHPLLSLLKNQFASTQDPTDKVAVHEQRMLFPLARLKDAFMYLIRAVMTHTNVDHVTYDGLDYYQRSDLLYERSPTRSYPEHDPDDNSSEQLYVGDDIEFNISYDFKKDDRFKELVWEEEDVHLKESIYEALRSEKPQDLLLPQFKKIVINNPCGYYGRAADNIAIELLFEETYVIEKSGITLDDFVEGLYITKSHKFDKYVEMFIEVDECSYENKSSYAIVDL